MGVFILKDVELFWASVHEPNKKDKYHKENPRYEVKAKLTPAQVKALKESDPILYTKLKTDKDGAINGDFVYIYTPMKKRDGTLTDAPDVIDSKRNPIPKNILLGNGTKAHIKYRSYETDMGAGVRLLAVMVKELEKFGADFDDEEGGYSVEGDDDDAPFDPDF